jgi:hypothetical protein
MLMIAKPSSYTHTNKRTAHFPGQVEAFAESLSTLKFAHRTKCVRNLPRVNEDLDHRTLLRKYERELRKLRAELAQKSKDLVDKRLVLQVRVPGGGGGGGGFGRE